MSAKHYVARINTLSLVIWNDSVQFIFIQTHEFINSFLKRILDVFYKVIVIFMLFINSSSQTPLDISINKWIFYFHFVHERKNLIIQGSDSLLTNDWHHSASLNESGYMPDPGRIQKEQQILQVPQTRHSFYLKMFMNTLSEDTRAQGQEWH